MFTRFSRSSSAARHTAAANRAMVECLEGRQLMSTTGITLTSATNFSGQAVAAVATLVELQQGTAVLSQSLIDSKTLPPPSTVTLAEMTARTRAVLAQVTASMPTAFPTTTSTSSLITALQPPTTASLATYGVQLIR